MTDIEKNHNRSSRMPLARQSMKDEHANKGTMYLSFSAVPNISRTINSEKVKLDNNNIKKLQANICKPVSVVLVRLSREMYKKYLYRRRTRNKQGKLKRCTKKKQRQVKQSNIPGVINSKKSKIQLGNGINSIADIDNEVEKTSLDLDDQREKEKEIVNNIETIPLLDKYIFKNQRITRNVMERTCYLKKLSERITDDKFKQSSYEYNHIESTYPSSSRNNDLTFTKELFQNKKNLDKRKYKRKHDDVSHEESVNKSNISNNQRKRRKKESNVEEQNHKIIKAKLPSHLMYSNIIDTKVVLTKLEDMHDNKYIINWRKKLSQQTRPTKYSKCNKRRKNISINTLFMKAVNSSHEDITKENDNNISIDVLKPKNKQFKNLKVLLIKLETLGVFLEEQNLVSKVEKLTAKYNDRFKLNFLNHSNNMITCNGESNTTEECTNETSLYMSSTEEENVINEHPEPKKTQNSSPLKRILQESSEKLSEKSESANNIECAGISERPIGEIKENFVLPPTTEKLQPEIIVKEALTSKINSPKSPEKASRNSSSKKVHLVIVSDVTSKSKPKESEILQSTITSKEDIYLRNCNETLHSTNSINCETVDVLQNNKTTMIDKDKECTLQKSSCTDSPLQLIIDESSSTNDSTNGLEDIDSLSETSANKESRTTNSSNVITEAGVSNTNSSKNLATEAQDIDALHPVSSNITMDSEKIEQSINNSFLYTCMACSSSFQEFQSLQLHLKECLAKPQKERSSNSNSIKLNVSEDSAKIAETLQYDDSTTDSNNRSLPIMTKKSLSTSKKCLIKEPKEKRKNRKNLSKKLQNATNIKCTVCSEVFDTMMSLSNHIYSHTEPELQQAYEIAKIKQGSTNGNEKTNMAVVDSNEKAQVAADKSSNTSSIKSTMAKSSNTISKNKRNENITNNIVSMEKTKSKEDVSNKAESSLSLVATTPNKQKFCKYSTMHSKKSMTFCECHKTECNKEGRIELVLLCSICNVLFRTKECFEAHFEKSEFSLCNTKRLTGRVPKLYCSICRIILYSYVDMRRHAENHIKNSQRIKLLCHICKVRFIGMGPIFNLHWFNHMRNVCYIALASNFPKTSLVDSNSKAWSLINTDEFNYLIITEHVCTFCNAQFLSTTQLQTHASFCPKRTNIELSNVVSATSSKDEEMESMSTLRLFCSVCNLTFLERSLFEMHAANHKQHLQPQYICLSVTDVKRIYICNICANVYESLKEFTTHWQDHNAIRENFMCNRCKQNFFTLETFMDHSKQCDISTIPVDMPSCQVTYEEAAYNCKICNIGFESNKALYQHSGIHNVKYPRLSIVWSNDAQNESNVQDISSECTTNLQSQLKEPISNDLTAETTTTDSIVAQENERTHKMLEKKGVSCTRTQSIESSKSSTEEKSVELIESDFDNVSINDTQSITNTDIETLSLLGETEADNLNVIQEKACFEQNEKSNDSANKTKENDEVINVSNVNDHSNKQDDTRNEETVETLNSKNKTDLNEITSPSEDNQKGTKDDDVILIRPEDTNKTKENTKSRSPTKIAKKTNDIPMEVVTLSDLVSNKSIESNEKSAETPKYLRVKNISELIDKKLTYTCNTCKKLFNDQENLNEHSWTHSQQQTPPTLSKNIPIFSNRLLSERDQKEQNVDSLKITNPLNLVVSVSNVSVQQPTYIHHNNSHMTTRYILKPPPPYTPTYTRPIEVTNIQYPNISTGSVVYNVNDKPQKVLVQTSGTYVPPMTVQSQNFNNDNQVQLVKALSSSNVTNLSTNLTNNNYSAQINNGTSMTTLPNLSSTSNYATNQGIERVQSQDTHNRIKLQNAVYNTYSNRRSKVIVASAKSTANTELASNVSRLPISSSNQYHTYGNISTINYSSTNVANTRYSQQTNSTMAVNTDSAQRLTNPEQMSNLYQLPVGNTTIVPPSQHQYTIHYGSSITSANSSSTSAVFVCHYCPKVIYFRTHQEWENHVNFEHNYICEICHERMFNSNELDFHRLKHDIICFENILQSQ